MILGMKKLHKKILKFYMLSSKHYFIIVCFQSTILLQIQLQGYRYFQVWACFKSRCRAANWLIHGVVNSPVNEIELFLSQQRHTQQVLKTYPNDPRILPPPSSTLMSYCGLQTNIWRISFEGNKDITYVFNMVLKKKKETKIYITENIF